MSLDRTDCALLKALQEDAEISNKQLAARVGLAPSSCLERVRRLRSAGVLRGAHARVEPEALGIGLQAVIFVKLQAHHPEKVSSLRDSLLRRPEVVALTYLAGSTDYLVHVAVRDVDHLRRFGLEALMGSRVVAHVETSLIFDHVRTPVLPDYTEAPRRK